MNTMYQTIGFIGAGNMGEAMIGALIQSKIFLTDRIFACDISEQRLDYMTRQYKINKLNDISQLFSDSAVVVLAVKPQQMRQTLEEITNSQSFRTYKRKLIISIAAGFPISAIENILYSDIEESVRKERPIIRVMPNTPALVLEGMSGMSPNRYANQEDIKITRTILESFGKVIEFEEKHLDAVTALSGSGPAYVFYLAEAMIEAGIKAGLTPENASLMTVTTIIGAMKLMAAQNESAESLRRKVTSPGGTTEAALKIFESNGVKSSIVQGILAAKLRSEELSKI